MLRIIARVLELEDEPTYEGYFPRVGGARDERCEVVVTVFGPDEVLLFHTATATAFGFETACQEAAFQMLAELRCMFDARLRTSIYRHLPSRSPGSGQSIYMGPSSASDPVGGHTLYMLSLQEAQARLASTRRGPRIRRTARKATGRPPWLQHQPPQPVSSPAEPGSLVVDAEDGVRDIEMIP
ncbi:hypothetical protein GUJ93_ZPchr0005g15356 [Zizania palustris]|uniref:Uncharacterized protein n=1 Tax=Zizania palustris TaxID=103762 RepID=A0A8J5VIR6_ZIZPA|nr:hypothetical protein GUJ93_ZPchr0005g15356 [Zizania palustris]